MPYKGALHYNVDKSEMAANVELFPVPKPLAHPLVPRPLPGSTYDSFKALQECLRDNHEKYHAYFDDRGFHNHMAHHLVALWSFGAPASHIKKTYALEATWQRPLTLGVHPSELEEITDVNFTKHLGEAKYFAAYIDYFTSIVNDIGPVAAIEEYVFTEKYNYDQALPKAKQPEMLSRYISSIFHSMIQTGYGLEFGLPGTVIEGLAQCAVHPSETGPITAQSLFPTYTPLPANREIHAFSVIARVRADPDMRLNIKPSPDAQGLQVLAIYCQEQERHLPRLLSWIDEWLAGIDVNDPNVSIVLAKKMEELIWACTVLYGVGGWAEGRDFLADFVMMHFVTAAIFLPSHHATLKPLSQLMLLRSYFAVILLWYIVDGRPGLDIEGFYKNTTTTPKISPNETQSANAWVPIIEASLTHPDEHLIKLQRALAHYSTIYGTRKFENVQTELEGAEYLDGTLFIRAAGLSQVRLERDRYVDMKEFQGRQWDRGYHMQ